MNVVSEALALGSSVLEDAVSIGEPQLVASGQGVDLWGLIGCWEAGI